MRKVIVAVASAATVTGGIALAASASAVTPPKYHCNQTVTGVVVLDRDYTCNSSSMFHVGADGTVINLNHHTIKAISSNAHDGIDLNNYDNLTVMNGSINGF